MSDLNRIEQIKALRSRAVRPARENTYWSSGECEFLRTMYHDGTGITDIAILLQRSETAIMQHCWILYGKIVKCWPVST